MGQKLSDADLELYRAVDEVLHYVWDPIGVADAPSARDEYYGYLATVFGVLKDGGNEALIASYLGQVATDLMGLDAAPERDMRVAGLLVGWREHVREKHA